ncbi:MAG: hypothetical protein ACO3CH_00365 [Ilumatobacteraceae bacterium]|nr:hypothetical protein [Chitinophagales bacterium]
MARQHGSKVITRLFKELQRLGFTVIGTKNNKFRIHPPAHIGGPVYFTHGTPKAVKPIVADMKKIYGVEVSIKDL